MEKALELLLANTHLLYRRVNNKIIVYKADDSTAGRNAAEVKAMAAIMAEGIVKGKSDE